MDVLKRFSTLRFARGTIRVYSLRVINNELTNIINIDPNELFVNIGLLEYRTDRPDPRLIEALQPFLRPDKNNHARIIASFENNFAAVIERYEERSHINGCESIKSLNEELETWSTAVIRRFGAFDRGSGALADLLRTMDRRFDYIEGMISELSELVEKPWAVATVCKRFPAVRSSETLPPLVNLTI